MTAEASVVGKYRWRVLAPIVLLIVLSSLDRVNISYAALQMNDALGLTAETYGRAVSVFFVGYLLFQFPSTALLTRVGARRWIAICVTAWGAVATLMALVRTPAELYVLRFLLGAAESGFAPGVVLYTSSWMPQRYRANTIAITMLAIPISVVIGGPLCGWLMSFDDALALPGWRFMMLLEGLVTVVLGVGAYFLFVDKPEDARWLSREELAWIRMELTREQQAKQATRSPPHYFIALLQVIKQSRLWLAAGVWASTLIGANGLMFWLPQVLKDVSSRSDLSIGVLSAVPWAGVACGMWINSWHSDKTQERYIHVGGALLVSACALYGASLLEPGAAALAMLFVYGAGLGSAQGVFWAIPTTFLARDLSANGVTLINLAGNIGSLVGPWAIGAIRAQSTSFAQPLWFVACVLGLGLLSLWALYERRTELA